MEQDKKDRMNGIKSRMQDVLHHQESLIEKLATIQIELFETPDKSLEQSVEKAHTQASANHDLIKAALEEYEMKINAM